MNTASVWFSLQCVCLNIPMNFQVTYKPLTCTVSISKLYAVLLSFKGGSLTTFMMILSLLNRQENSHQECERQLCAIIRKRRLTVRIFTGRCQGSLDFWFLSRTEEVSARPPFSWDVEASPRDQPPRLEAAWLPPRIGWFCI